MISDPVAAGFSLRDAAMEGIPCSGAYSPFERLNDG
jgi:hypothetical protein